MRAILALIMSISFMTLAPCQCFLFDLVLEVVKQGVDGMRRRN